MNSDYRSLKIKYSHESALNSDAANTAGTVFTPDKLSKDMIFLMLSSHFKQNYEHSISNSETNEEAFKNLYINGFLKDDYLYPAESAKFILERITHLKLLDLSCGSGLLILAYLELLIYLFKVSNLPFEKILFRILNKQIYGFDINSDSIDVFKKLLNAFAKTYSIKAIKPHLYCLNSLVESLPDTAKDFDLIIGNPPYIGEKGNRDVFAPIKETELGIEFYEGKMDYFYFFIYRGYSLLKSNGTLCYLTSNYFFTADGAKKLRSFIHNSFYLSKMINYGSEQVFKNRRLHACVFTLQKQITQKVNIVSDDLQNIIDLYHNQIFHSDELMYFIEDPILLEIVTHMKKQSKYLLGEHFEVHQGIVTGADRSKAIVDDPKGIFVYHESEIDALPEPLKIYLHPFFKNRSIKHYHHEKETPYYVLYIDEKETDESVLLHLEQFRSILEKRREVQKHIRNWYMLTWPRTKSIFESEKIVVPQRAKSNYFAYSPDHFFASADVYYILKTIHSDISLKALTMVLNSKLYFLWFRFAGKRKGELLELYATPLKKVPLPQFTKLQIDELEVLATMFYDVANNLSIITRVESIVLEAFKLTEKKDYL